MEIKKLEPMQGWRWFSIAWEDTKGARLDFLAASLITFFIQACLSVIPLLGSLLSAFSMTFLGAGLFLLGRNWKKERRALLSDLFVPIRDREIRERLIPIAAVNTALMLFFKVSTSVSLVLTGFVGLLMVAIVPFFYFAIPLVLFEKLDWKKAVSTSIEACLINALPLTVFTLGGMLWMLVAIATLFIGLFWLLPVSVYLSHYLIYAEIFGEDLSPKITID